MGMTPTGFTALAATRIQDAAGNPLTGTLVVTPTDATDTPVASVAGGVGGAVLEPATFVFTAGVLAANSWVPDSALTTNPHTSYRFTFEDPTGKTLKIWRTVQPTGATFNLDTYQPILTAPQAIIQAGPTGQGFNFRGPWAPATQYNPYDVLTNAGTSYFVPTGFLSGATFAVGSLVVMAQNGALTGAVATHFDAPLGASVENGLTADTSNIAAMTVGALTFVPLPENNQNAVFAVLDPSGNASLYIDKLGNVVVANLMPVTLRPASTVIGGLTLQPLAANDQNAIAALLDPHGNAASYVQANGTHVIGSAIVANLTVTGRLTVPSSVSGIASTATEAPLSGGTPRTLFGLNLIVGIGQSLMTGYHSTILAGSATVRTTAQPLLNLMFNGGPRMGTADSNSAVLTANIASLQPLTEVYDPTIDLGETIMSGLCNRSARELMAIGLHLRFLAIVTALGGTSYSGLAQGTTTYINTLTAVARAVILGSTYGTVGVQALAVLHGENDDSNNNLSYGANLATWLANYNTDLAALTGQTQNIPMLISQTATYGTTGGQRTYPVTNPQVLALAETNPNVFLVNPKYIHTHAPQDGVHLTADSERWHGEYFSVALDSILAGKGWTGLRPRSWARLGTLVTVDFYVPCGPLVFDTAQVTQPALWPGSMYGFEFDDGSGAPPAIVAAVIRPNRTTVEFTLAFAPTGPTPVIRYAWTAAPGVIAGPLTGPRGNLRDSSPAQSFYGYPNLYNWCQSFSKAL